MTIGRASRWGTVLILMLAAVLLRVFFSGLKEYRAGQASLERKDADEAIVRFRRAAAWYFPGNPLVRRSLDALETLATASEATGDRKLARKAWEAERAALLGTRSTYTPFSDRLARANERIAHLLVAEEGSRQGETHADQLAYHKGLLDRNLAPHVGWALTALLGFAIWTGAALLFIFRGLSENGTLRLRPAFLCLLLIVAGFGAFMLGLSRA